MKIAARIANYRLTHNLTQSQLATILGCTQSQLYKSEHAILYPTYPVLVRMSRLLKISFEELLGEDSTKIADTGHYIRYILDGNNET